MVWISVLQSSVPMAIIHTASTPKVKERCNWACQGLAEDVP
jgi:hypothetical protein